MPVRYAPMIAPAPKEFVEPNSSDYFIWWLFRNRCVSCRKPGQEVNEIIPRSRSKKSILNWENRVLMCRECHNEYHKHGVNSKTIEALQQKRYDFLMANGREEYANYVPLMKVEEFGTSPIEATLEIFMKEQAIKIASVFGASKELLK